MLERLYLRQWIYYLLPNCTLKLAYSGSAIEALRKIEHAQRDVAVAYTFIRYIEKYLARDILASLLGQIIRSHPAALNTVRSLYLQLRASDEPLTEDRLKSLLQDIVSSFQRVFFVVDGLDEAMDEVKDDLLESLTSLSGASLLILSRPLDSFVTTYTPSAIRISIQAQTDDIDTYVRDKVKRSARLTRVLGKDGTKIGELSHLVRHKSQGM